MQAPHSASGRGGSQPWGEQPCEGPAPCTTQTVPPTLADPLALPVLVLNKVFQPVRITTARRALKLLYSGSARALNAAGELFDFSGWQQLPVREGLDAPVGVVNGALRVPRIVHLRRYARVRRAPVRLSRRNVMLRDDHRCQYCDTRAPAVRLNIDHVIPRSRGGEDSWTNLVTACEACNRRKGHRTPREAEMPLLRLPRSPRWTVAAQLLAGVIEPCDEWEPFLRTG